jgi:fatty-acyl-CoA synthase
LSARTVAGALRRRAESHPEAPAIRFSDGALTSGQLWEACLRVAAGLRARGLRGGDRVLVLAPDVREAVLAHLGAWTAGVSPLHVGLPWRMGDPAAFIAALGATAARVESRALLVSASVAPFAPADDPTVAAIGALAATDPGGPAPDPDEHPPDLLQLTSGSTGRPRVVVVPHERVVRHLEAISHALPAGDDASVVSWLPLHHDMGLVGGLLYPLHNGARLRLLAPVEFQAQPLAWLSALSAERATHTPGPPSAYALVLRLAARAREQGLRLDALRCAMIGAEPISAALLRRFAAAFAPCGFRSEAFFPVYGLAEATVALTFPEPLRPACVAVIDRAELARTGAAVPARDGAALEVVGTGRPLPGVAIRITDAAGVDLPDGRAGHILARSPSLMVRYHGEPEATAEALQEGWLHTGDLGFVEDGVLFVTGRAKEVLIRGGHNLLPGPIEEVVGAVEGVRAGCVAAVGIRAEALETERILVVAETRLAADAWPDLTDRIREALRRDGVTVDEIVLCAPGSLPKTTSGKLCRAEVARGISAARASGR